jgi:hypothetical protein
MITKTDAEYFELAAKTVHRAGRQGYLMIGVGAEPENIFDRQHQLVTRHGHKLIMTGTVRVLAAWLDDAERQ